MENKENNQEKNHSPSYHIYLFVWFALIVLTGLTVSIAGMNLGKYTVATALLIAAVKTYLVLTIFMHLRTESRTFKLFIAVSLFFLFVSFALLFSDYSFI